jgi:dTDP-4-dehydrorhamnose 3,5-epimerase
MQVIETEIPGVLILEPRVFGDERGFLFESYHLERFAALGVTSQFVQDNHSRSCRNTLRGLHYQLAHPQAKLCRVVRGEVLDVVVDIRRGSPAFGKWVSVLLSEDNKRTVYIPRGLAHGFLVLSESADFLYKCDDYYHPDDQYGIAWNDAQIGIDWPLPGAPILSEKDERLPRLADVSPDHLPLFE